jgi:hypothetical protein
MRKVRISGTNQHAVALAILRMRELGCDAQIDWFLPAGTYSWSATIGLLEDLSFVTVWGGSPLLPAVETFFRARDLRSKINS